MVKMLAMPLFQLPLVNRRVGEGKLSLLRIKVSKTGPQQHSKNGSVDIELWSNSLMKHPVYFQSLGDLKRDSTSQSSFLRITLATAAKGPHHHYIWHL